MPKDINVWALLKDFVGKGELSKITTPVQFLEPLSELQQRCEDLKYSELLDQAGTLSPSCILQACPVNLSYGRLIACA